MVLLRAPLVLAVSLLACSGGPAEPDSGVASDSSVALDSSAAVDSASDTGQPVADGPGIQHAFFVVHMEPATPVDPVEGTINHSRPIEYLDELVSLVELADLHDQKLTLMFSPQWGSYLGTADCDAMLADDPFGLYDYGAETHSDCISLVRAMEAAGHELAMHHHPLEAPSGWDGFTNESQWTADRDGDGKPELYTSDAAGEDADPWYLGTLSDMMGHLDPLPASGPDQILTATTEEYPPSVRYSTAGGPVDYEGPDDWGDLLSQPCATEYDGHGVWQLRMRLYNNDDNVDDVLNHELPAVLAEDFGAEPEALTLGFITHAKNVEDTALPPYADLFTELADHGLQLTTVSEIMGAYPQTKSDPLSTEESQQCPPEESDAARD